MADSVNSTRISPGQHRAIVTDFHKMPTDLPNAIGPATATPGILEVVVDTMKDSHGGDS